MRAEGRASQLSGATATGYGEEEGGGVGCIPEGEYMIWMRAEGRALQCSGGIATGSGEGKGALQPSGG